jgi:hypothetical protein
MECLTLRTYISHFTPWHKKSEHPGTVQLVFLNVIITWKPFTDEFGFGFVSVLSDDATTFPPPACFQIGDVSARLSSTGLLFVFGWRIRVTIIRIEKKIEVIAVFELNASISVLF